MLNMEWKKTQRIRAKELVDVYSLSVKHICCNIEKGRKDKYIFTIWDGGTVKTSLDFNVSFSTLEEAKSFCEEYVINSVKNTDSLDELNKVFKVKSFETIVDEMKGSYKDDVCDTKRYSTGEEFEAWLKDRKRHNKES